MQQTAESAVLQTKAEYSIYGESKRDGITGIIKQSIGLSRPDGIFAKKISSPEILLIGDTSKLQRSNYHNHLTMDKQNLVVFLLKITACPASGEKIAISAGERTRFSGPPFLVVIPSRKGS